MEISREPYVFSPDQTGVLLPPAHDVIGMPYREAYVAWENHLATCPPCAHQSLWAENSWCERGATLWQAASLALRAQRARAHAN